MTNPFHTITKAGGDIVDAVSDLTRYAAVRVPLQKAKHPGEVTLDLTGYRQVNTYGCGAIAAAMIVKFFHPKTSFEHIYGTVDPDAEYGALDGPVIKALRSLGVTVSKRRCLSFTTICQAIDKGSPIMVCMATYDPEVLHWVVLYGYGRDPRLVFIAGKGIHFLDRQRMKWKDFRDKWMPHGEGLVCRKSTIPKNVRPPHRAKMRL